MTTTTTTTHTVLDGIIDRHARYGWSAPVSGEWETINRDTRQFLRDTLERADRVCLDYQLSTMFRQPIIGGLISSVWMKVLPRRAAPDEWWQHYPQLVQYHDGQWLRAHAHEIGQNVLIWTGFAHPSPELELLRAPDIGEPITHEVGGVPIMADTPRHDHYALAATRWLPPGGVLLEIGGGYGGTARQLLQRRPDATVWLVDLPETLYLAWYWLAEQGLPVRWHDEPGSGGGEVVLLPAGMDWPAGIDLVLAAHCLSEMPAAVVRGYMAQLRASGAGRYLHDSAHVHCNDGLHDTATCILFPEQPAELADPGEPYREVWRAPSWWAATGNRYWTFLYHRTEP